LWEYVPEIAEEEEEEKEISDEATRHKGIMSFLLQKNDLPKMFFVDPR
jgi:hypothetical protein